jgi:hypothetical protein
MQIRPYQPLRTTSRLTQHPTERIPGERRRTIRSQIIAHTRVREPRHHRPTQRVIVIRPPTRHHTLRTHLTKRIACDANEILQFTTDTAIWFSNNQSERDLRPTKLQLKISATWRSLQGLADFAALRSYLSTASKHGEDLLEILTALFTTGPWLPPDLVPDPS